MKLVTVSKETLNNMGMADIESNDDEEEKVPMI